MTLSRRRFLLSGLVALGASVLGFFGWRRGRGGMVDEVGSLTALADTLVPADEFPGAVQVGVPALLEKRLALSEGRREIYRAGLRRLDQLANEMRGSSFSRLPRELRTEVLERIAGGNGAQLQDLRVFFGLARRDVLRAFYSTPEAREMLGYRPPREGYPDG